MLLGRYENPSLACRAIAPSRAPGPGPTSVALARALGIKLRWLPTACPELNVMDTLWHAAKANTVANEPTPNVDDTTQAMIHYLAHLTRHERLRKAGVLSDDFWLKAVCSAHVSRYFS